jgi:hypothetical protein
MERELARAQAILAYIGQASWEFHGPLRPGYWGQNAIIFPRHTNPRPGPPAVWNSARRASTYDSHAHNWFDSIGVIGHGLSLVGWPYYR